MKETTQSPIDKKVRELILEKLAQVEKEHDVHVLFACESGSRCWGFASPDSDYDVRFIYVHRLPWYVSVNDKRDVIELAIEGDLDINGWDLKKALSLLRQSNPTLLEWLRSPIVYHSDEVAMERMLNLARAYYSPSRIWQHYRSMAIKHFKQYLQGENVQSKKYLYAIRSVLAAKWIEQRKSFPPLVFSELAEQMLDPGKDAAVIAQLQQLLESKRQSKEALTTALCSQLHAYLEQSLQHFKDEPFQHREKENQNAKALDAFLFEMAMAQHTEESLC